MWVIPCRFELEYDDAMRMAYENESSALLVDGERGNL